MLNIEDQLERQNFVRVLEVMELQGASGITQPSDYVDAIQYLKEIDGQNKLESQQISVLEHFDSLVFDFDGVIADSTVSMYEGAKEIIDTFAGSDIPKGQVPQTTDDVANTYSSPGSQYYKRFGIKSNGINDHYLKVIFPKMKEVHGIPKIYPEVPYVFEVIRNAKLVNSSLKIYLLTAGSEAHVNDILKESGYLSIFDDIFYNEYDKKSRLQNLKELNGNIVMIGDLPSDIKDGKAVGIKTIAVGRGARQKSRLGYFLPDFVIENLAELFDVNKELQSAIENMNDSDLLRSISNSRSSNGISHFLKGCEFELLTRIANGTITSAPDGFEDLFQEFQLLVESQLATEVQTEVEQQDELQQVLEVQFAEEYKAEAADESLEKESSKE
jgi:phosphoglycolate phosphatase-like HAD superfamily hydrolase